MFRVRCARTALGVLLSSAVLVIASAFAPWSTAEAKKTKTLHAFCTEQCYDGYGPAGGSLTTDASGNLFGATNNGGTLGRGTLFEIQRRPGRSGGKFRILYNFCECAKGSAIEGKLVVDVSGDIYGVAVGGGAVSEGVVFKLSPNANGKHWSIRVLHDFCAKNSSCPDGTQPNAGLTYAGAAEGLPYDGVSPLYGATFGGGKYHQGVVFSISPRANGKWKLSTLYAFCQAPDCADGRTPDALIADASGNLFGATQAGGGNDGDLNHEGGGVAFKLSPGSGSKSWTETLLYSFCAQEPACADGQRPFGIVLDETGDVFGLASGGTSETCGTQCGIAFKIGSDGNYSKIYEFCSKNKCADGYDPTALSLDGAGNIFGVTGLGGKNNAGTLLMLNGGSKVLHDFCAEANCADGKFPTGITSDRSGKLFGVTGTGGAFVEGTIFELTP